MSAGHLSSPPSYSVLIGGIFALQRGLPSQRVDAGNPEWLVIGILMVSAGLIAGEVERRVERPMRIN